MDELSGRKTIYFVSYINRLGKRVQSRHRVSLEDAAIQFAGMDYRIVEAGKLELDGTSAQMANTGMFKNRD
jgi:hypothetical protein